VSNLRDLLMEVRTNRGALTPRTVFETAQDETHPLHEHPRFEWDHDIAWERYNLIAAADIIRSVKVRFVRPTGEPGQVRQFCISSQLDGELPGRADRVYEPIENIAANPVARQVLLRAMQRDWATFKARYSAMNEFIELIQAEVTAAA
jgi:hypothetical protein